MAVSESDLFALCAAVEEAIETVRANATGALARIDPLRHAAHAAVDANPSDDKEAAHLAIDTRCAELAAGIQRAEAIKIAALEAELVAADAAICRLQNYADTSASLELFSRYGPSPLVPAEPSSLFLDEIGAGTGIATLCATRRVEVHNLGIRSESLAWVLAGAGPICFDVTFLGVRGARASKLHAAASALTDRLRVSAALVPFVDGVPPSGARSSVPGQPLSVAVQVNARGDGATVGITLPTTLKPAADAAGWAVRILRIGVGGSEVDLGPLSAAAMRVFTLHAHSRHCKHDDVDAGAVFRAAKAGKVAAVAAALAAGGSTEEADEHGVTPLLVAIELGHRNTARTLLEAGAIFTTKVRSALHAAIRKKDTPMVTLIWALLKHCNAIEHEDIGSHLCAAAHNGNADTVRILLSLPLSTLPAPWDDRWKGSKPLYVAALHGSTEIVSLMLADSRIDPNECGGRDGGGDTPLQVAVRWGHTAVVAALLSCPRVDVTKKFQGRPDLTLLAFAQRESDRSMYTILAADPRLNPGH